MAGVEVTYLLLIDSCIQTSLKVYHVIANVGEDRLVGLMIKASASTAEDPGFESRSRRDLFGVESYQ